MLAAIAGLAAILALGACDRNSVEDLLKQAETSRASGNIRAGMIQLKNALQKDPQNARARLLLGQTFLDLGDGAQAEIELKRAHELGAPAERATLLLLEAKLIQGKAQEVVREFPEFDSYPPATRAAFLVLRAQTHLASGQVAEAEQAFTNATRVDEAALDAWLGLTRLALARGNAAGAQGHFARAAAIAPDDYKTLLVQGDLATQSGKFEEAEKAYRAVLTKRKDDQAALRAHFGVAQSLLSQNKTQEAIDRLTAVLKVAPNHPIPNYLRAFAAYRLKDYQAAKTHAELTLRVQPAHRGALFIAGGSSYALNQFEQALKHLNAFVAQAPDNAEGRKMLAATQMRLGDPKRAVGTLQPALTTKDSDPQVVAMTGLASAQAGDPATAREKLAEAATLPSTDPDVRARIGLARVAIGDQGGMEDLEAASKLDQELGQADGALVAAHMRNREFDKALEAATRARDKQPNRAAGHLLVGIVQARLENIDAARQSLQKALEIQPGHLQALLTLANVEGRAGRAAEAVGYLEKAIQANPDSVYPRLVLARMYMVRNEHQKALATAKLGLQKKTNDLGLLEVVGRAQLALGQPNEAASAFETLVAARPESTFAHIYLATAYERAGTLERALAQLDRAARVTTNPLLPRLERARMLAAAGRVDDAQKVLADLRASNPDHPAVAALEGALAQATNRPAEAAAALKRAMGAKPSSGLLIRLVRAQLQAGQAAEAQQVLSEWLTKNPEDAPVRQALAEVLIATHQYPQAAAEYAKLHELAPNNSAILNNLAWLTAETGHSRDALGYARRAAELSPGNPLILDTLGVVLLRSDNVAEAVGVLRKASEIAPAMGTIKLNLARALMRGGNPAEARTLLQGLVASDPQSRGSAEELLREIGG
jgi:tetratricopeptide (TPR) repeat protein